MHRAAKSLLVVLLAVLPQAHAAPVGIVGEWILVEQSYGEGRANLPVDPDPAARLRLDVRLVVPHEASGFTVRVRADGRQNSDAPKVAWPAWVTDDGPLPLESIERTLDPVEGVLSARYAVSPARNGDTTLRVVERYRLEDGALVGTVQVTFERDGARRGGYTLHRRFEKAP